MNTHVSRGQTLIEKTEGSTKRLFGCRLVLLSSLIGRLLPNGWKKKGRQGERETGSPCWPGLPCCCQRPGRSRRAAPAWCARRRPEAAAEAGKLSHPWLKIHPLLRVSATFLSFPGVLGGGAERFPFCRTERFAAATTCDETREGRRTPRYQIVFFQRWGGRERLRK